MATTRKVLCKGGCGKERELGPPAKARRDENYTVSPSWMCDDCRAERKKAAEAAQGGPAGAAPSMPAMAARPRVVERTGTPEIPAAPPAPGA